MSVRGDGQALLIGNSRWHWAQHNGERWSVEHTDPAPERIGDALNVWAAVGPVPAALERLDDRRIRTRDVPLDHAPPWLGVDRALGSWQAWRRSQHLEHDCSQGLTVVDAGTVLSITVLDADGCFRGGQLIPGYRLQLRAMAEGTAALPSTLAWPDQNDPFPQNTVAAMQQGVVRGLVAAIQQAQRCAGGVLWLCGGDAQLLAQQLSHASDPVHVSSDLQLEGLMELSGGLSSNPDR